MSDFHVTAKPSGSLCNIDCDYCFYLEKEKLYPERNKTVGMDDKTLEIYIKQYIQAQKGNNVLFSWQGGEPTLLGLAFFNKVIAFQNKYANGKLISNTLQTNGILINEEWCHFFRQHEFLIGLSLDGPKEINDSYRKSRSQKSTFSKVINTVELFNKFNIDYNILAVVSKANVDKPIEVYEFFKSIGARHFQFTPLVERIANTPTKDGLTLISPTDMSQATVAPWSVDASAYGEFITTMFDHWIKHDLGEVFIQTFENTLGKMLGEPGNLCVFEKECGNALALELNGDTYSCDHFVYPEYKLGNIHTEQLENIANSPKATKFGSDKKTNMATECNTCPFLSICNGGCPKHRFELSSSGIPNKNYFCNGYKKIFLHIEKYIPTFKNAFELGLNAEDIKKTISNN
ncbi:anaerobic sulfatase maturase [Vibrio nomapromontoriensis]|uniref:anaerobic sulfatase maturase n=1 Tax=Vibrio nomapromontoriensis TaxID=2910246 RepID=UPI003D0B9BC1